MPHRRAVLLVCAALTGGCGGADVHVDARPVALRAATHPPAAPARALEISQPPYGTALVAIDLPSGRRHVLARSRAINGGDVGLRSPVLSPDGRRAAVVSVVGAPDYRTISTILVVPTSGRGRARHVPGFRMVDGDSLRPVWTPDGRSLAVPRDSEHDVVDLVDVRTGRHRPLLRGNAGGPLAFAPDGKTYAFSGPDGLWLRRGHRPAHLVAPDASNPAWSPDGHRLAYLSTRDHHGTVDFGDAGTGVAAEVYVADAAGRHPRRLTHTTTDELPPVRWTTDGAAVIASGRAIGVTGRCANAPLAIAAEDEISWDVHAPLAAATSGACR